jgi:dolichol-phosphate mannosyltransferase
VSSGPKKLSVIIPVYNEEQYVAAVLKRLLKLKLPFGLEKELIVVDDGSTDKTRQILGRQPKDPALQIHYQKQNFGKGSAIREALKHVTGDIVLIQDADLEYSMADYPALLEPIVTGKAKVVYGSRFLGKITGMKFANRMFNHLIRGLVNVLFGSKITDEATAYKVFSADVLKSLNLASDRFEICPEMTAKVLKKNVSIFEVPIRYRGRTLLQGKKIRWTDAVSAIWTLVKYRCLS